MERNELIEEGEIEKYQISERKLWEQRYVLLMQGWGEALRLASFRVPRAHREKHGAFLRQKRGTAWEHGYFELYWAFELPAHATWSIYLHLHKV